MLLLQARVDLGVMAMKRYFTFPEAPALLEPHHQVRLFSVISSLLASGGGGLTPLQRRSQRILQPQLIGQYTELNVKTFLFQIIQFSISTQFRCQNNSISSNSV